MVMLFKKINAKQTLGLFKLAFEHGRNLGLFVCGYKALCILLEKLWGKKKVNSFISGFIFGGLIFGKKTPVNYQIVLYLLSRTILGLISLLYKKYWRKRWMQVKKPIERKYGHLLMAAIVWGLVMLIF